MRTAGWWIIWKKTITVIDATFVACLTGAFWAKWGENCISCCQSILVGVGGWKSQNNGMVMHGLILLETMHPAPFPGTPPGNCKFFFAGRSIPHCWAERQFPIPELLIDHVYVFCCIFLIHTKQNDMFSQLLWTFSWVYREKDNGCHNVVKTWTINLIMKMKKKKLFKKHLLDRTLHETLDWISVSLYISKALYSFLYKNSSLFKAISWRNISVLAFQKM